MVLADSSASVRANIMRLLSQMPEIEVIAECETADETIAAVRKFKPEIVFTEFVLDKGSAVDVLRSCRVMKPRPICIVHTTQTDASTRAICYACGADVFYDKNRDLIPLLNMLRKLAVAMTNHDVLQAA